MSDVRTQPRDRTKTEHVGSVDKVIWHDDEKPVSILALVDGLKVVVDAPSSAFTRGQLYRFLGRWEEGPRGPQFAAGTFVRLELVPKPLGKTVADPGADFRQVLQHPGFGVGFEPDAVKMLREEPDKVASAGVMSADAARDAARDLARFAGLEGTRVDLFGLFSGRGFPRKLVEHAISKWGANAPEIIKADPFHLLTGRLPGCGFRRVDKLYCDLGKRRNALKRQALAGWNALREDRTGSTWLPAQLVVSAIEQAVPGTDDPVKAIKLGIRGGLFRLRRDGSARWVAVADHARAEQRVADSTARLRKSLSMWPTDIPISTDEGDGLPSEHQRAELLKAISSPIGCFTGGPGTGKTHTLSFALRRVVEQFGEKLVAVCAPTGKAAVRATESLAARGVPIGATTVHQLLEIGRSGHDGQGWGFQRNRDNPLTQRFVIVDETSMKDTSLMADLLDACGDGTQVLFVGDPFQLAPVGHGAPLRDFLAAGLAQGELTEVRRNAGLIVRACAAIKAGHSPIFTDRFDLDADDPQNLRFIECRPDETLDLIEDVLASMSRFDPLWDCQILVGTNDKSDVSRKAVNARFTKVLNPSGRKVPGIPFAVGDKVICTSNSRLRVATPAGKFFTPQQAEDAGNYIANPDSEVYIANGEIGRVAAVGSGGMVFTVGPKSAWVPKSKPKSDDDGDEADKPAGGGAMGDFEPACAITGHKSQGSEWPVTIIVADKAAGAVADRNWWYTTISRASKACLIVGDRAAFDAQRRRQSLIHRKTFLAELIRGDAEQSR
jgi:exodeoxyribonuclease V alpha subunit